MRRFLRFLPIILLAGCATAPKGPAVPTSVHPEAAPAYATLAQGDFENAYRRFQDLAAQSQPPQRQEYQLGAAEALIYAERLPEAGQLLASIDGRGMNGRDIIRQQLLEARLALKKRDGAAALTALARPLAQPMEADLAADYHLLRGLAYTQNGNPLEAAREYTLRAPYLTHPAQSLANQRATMEALAQVSETVLLALQITPPPDVFSGWMELARIDKSRQNLTGFEAQLGQWRFKYPDHPVREEILAELRQRAAEMLEAPSRIALILPLTGNLRDAATAVRDGVLAAHYANPERETVSLRTYDIGPDAASVISVYERAVGDGAQFIIGPLRKEEVETLAQRGDLRVPVLALNNIDSTWLPSGLYQFGLAPEEEARQVAERAWLDGHTHAAMITPNGPWGSRIAQAFRDKWIELGGQVVASASYESQENDYGAPLRAMFNLDASNRRHTQVEHLLGRSLEFSPRRRQDVDFIFLAAFPRQARLLRPQIKFHHATGLPVYATSHVFTGSIAPEQDRDMDDTVFGDMPWVLEGLQPAALKRHEGQMARLVALGADAYDLLRYLRLLENHPAERYEGGTGVLQLDSSRKIQRQLAWARFTAGRPRPLELEAVLPRTPAQ